MAFKRLLTGAGGQVPDPNLPVIAARSKQPAVGREGHGFDGIPAKSLKLVLPLLALLVQLFCRY